MEKFNYEIYYKSKDDGADAFLKYVCEDKSYKINKLITQENFSIIEVGSGPGHVLHNILNAKIRIGLDISTQAIRKHIDNYFIRKAAIDEIENIEIDLLYHPIGERDISENFINRNIIKDTNSNLFLLINDADKGLPLENQSVDYVLLCDILEHVNDPKKLLMEAKRIGKKVIAKIPIENAVLPRLSLWLNNIKYGVNHPSGHLFCWNYQQIFTLIKHSNLNVESFQINSFEYNTSENKTIIKRIIIIIFYILDIIFKTKKISLFFLGGDFYGILV